MSANKQHKNQIDVCMNIACAGAADGCTELHSVAVRENEQYRSKGKASLPRTGPERAGGAGSGAAEGGGFLRSGGGE